MARNILKFGLLYINPWTARTRVKDILRVIVWARHNGIKVRCLRQDEINQALARPFKNEIRTPRLKVFKVVDDERN